MTKTKTDVLAALDRLLAHAEQMAATTGDAGWVKAQKRGAEQAMSLAIEVDALIADGKLTAATALLADAGYRV